MTEKLIEIDIEDIRLRELFPKTTALFKNMSTIVLGKEDQHMLLLTCIFADVHAYYEDVPGTAKTLSAKTVASSVEKEDSDDKSEDVPIFSRIQGQPNLDEGDILGPEFPERTTIVDSETGKEVTTTRIVFTKGPIFAHIVLIDEGNRIIPGAQSAFLEVMEERTVTAAGRKYNLPRFFIVILTENPVDTEGVYALLEPQLDRFGLRIVMGHPEHDDAVKILEGRDNETLSELLDKIKPVITTGEIVEAQRLIRKKVHIDSSLREWIVDLTEAARYFAEEKSGYGASQRGANILQQCSKALAFLRGRDYVLPEDVEYLIVPALYHRTSVSHNERLDVESFKREILKRAPSPVREK